MKKSTLLALVTVALGVVALGGVIYAADLAGDQILDKMIDHQDEIMGGSPSDRPTRAYRTWLSCITRSRRTSPGRSSSP